MGDKTNKIISSKTFVRVLAIIVAFFCWLFVASVGNTIRSNTITGVPIDITAQEKILSELGLNVIEISATEVTANIKGERVVVGNITPEDVVATVKIPNTTNSVENEFELALVPLSSTNGDKNYEVVSYSPSHIKIKLDNIETKTLSITADIDGEVVIADGFIQQKAPTLSPDNITISGPKQEVDKISRAVVKLTITNELSSSYVSDQEIILLDNEGEQVNILENHITVNEDTARVVIPVLKERKLPLTVNFVNIPRNFPTEKLDYSRSDKEIMLAGDPQEIDKYNEIVLGYVDISQLSKSKNQFAFDIDLPANFVNINNLETATVTFNTDSWEETTLDITEIKLLNTPDNYLVELVTQSVNNVLIVGEKSIVDNLTPTDFVAEVDFAQRKEISVGQYQYPVSISAPGKDGLVWASGEYSLVVRVSREE